jgi:hypothetical protein
MHEFLSRNGEPNRRKYTQMLTQRMVDVAWWPCVRHAHAAITVAISLDEKTTTRPPGLLLFLNNQANFIDSIKWLHRLQAIAG